MFKDKLDMFDSYNELLPQDLKMIAHADKLIEMYPDNLKLYLEKAAIYKEAYNERKLALTFSEIFEKFPTEIEPYIIFASHLRDITEHKPAKMVIAAGLKIDPTNKELLDIADYIRKEEESWKNEVD